LAIKKKSITMHGNMNVKRLQIVPTTFIDTYLASLGLWCTDAYQYITDTSKI